MTAPAAAVGRHQIAGFHRITAGGRDLVTDSNGGLHYAPADIIQVATPKETP